MNRELEVQRDRLMDMGDWAKDGQFLGKVAPQETIQLKEKAFSV
jgi:SET and MYND domain-containing protein